MISERALKLNIHIKTLVIASIVALALTVPVFLGIHTIGPLHSLSTDCSKGQVKVIDDYPGAKPGPYDYECH